MKTAKLNIYFIIFCCSLLFGCNDLETDISKKPEFPFFMSAFDSFVSMNSQLVDIPNHSEMVDFIDYAVYPNPFTVNEISYKISEVFSGTTSQTMDLKVYYRNALMDTIPLFEVADLNLIAGERTDVNVSAADLSSLTQLVNNQSTFLTIVEATGDTQLFDFTIEIYFDTTITIDYDL